MNIHEYQAKQVLSKYGVPVPNGEVANSAVEAVEKAKSLGGNKWVVKAQLHSGARGKAGGVKLCTSEQEIVDLCNNLLGKNLVTHQTGPEGKMVSSMYVEEASDIAKELYFSIVLDRSTEKATIITSTEGGMDIEEVAQKNPEKISTINIDPGLGIQAFQARKLVYSLNLPKEAVAQATRTIMSCYRCLLETDANQLEINPLILTKDNNIVCLDAKMNFDDNALFKHPEIMELRDLNEEEETEIEASKHDLAYIKLDGSIGCMVNGAGLAMATMDIIKLYGEEPANFLDVGGGASKEKVSAAFKIILSDKNVKGILINIFGGIMRCDVLAKGLVEAAREIKINVPLVVRLAGTNFEEGKKILDNSGLKIISASDLGDAAEKVVEAIK